MNSNSIASLHSKLLSILKDANITNKPLLTYITLLIFFICGLIGFIVNLSALNSGSFERNGVRVAYPYVSNVWVTLLLMFYSLSSLILIHSKSTLLYFNSKKSLCNSYISEYYWEYYYYYITLFSLLLMIGWFVGYNNSAGLWCIELILLSIFNIFLHKQLHDSTCSIVVDDSIDKDSSSHTINAIIEENSLDNLQTALTESNYNVKALNYLQTFGIGLFTFLRIVVFSITGLLLGGTYLQAHGYRTYKPHGKFIEITYANGYKQKILTQCVGSRNSAVPTIWVEVGGGGHSMSDLWGLRDYIQTNYGRRYCSYDMPGTGWSDPSISLQPQITSQVIEAMQEPGPFICLGSMDDGDQRCLIFCVQHPSMCSAVVPVAFGSPSEFQLYCNYYGCSYEEQIALMKNACAQRMTFGNIINFFGVSWGLVNSIITNPGYVPATLAHESLFLNVLNEKQWGTNTNILYECSKNPSSGLGFVGNSTWQDSNYNLDQKIPVYGFALGMTEAQLNQQCKDYNYAIGSKDCGYLHYIYNETLSIDQEIIKRNPNSKLFICTDACIAAKGNSFLIDQESMIPWFADTMFNAIKGITI